MVMHVGICKDLKCGTCWNRWKDAAEPHEVQDLADTSLPETALEAAVQPPLRSSLFYMARISYMDTAARIVCFVQHVTYSASDTMALELALSVCHGIKGLGTTHHCNTSYQNLTIHLQLIFNAGREKT